MVELGFALPFWFLSIAYVYVLVWGGNYGGPLPRRASFAYDFIICSSSGSKKAIFLLVVCLLGVIFVVMRSRLWGCVVLLLVPFHHLVIAWSFPVLGFFAWWF